MSLRSRVVDAVFGGLEGLAALYDLVRRLRRPSPDELPLSHRDVERQQAQIRSATLPIPPPRH